MGRSIACGRSIVVAVNVVNGAFTARSLAIIVQQKIVAKKVMTNKS